MRLETELVISLKSLEHNVKELDKIAPHNQKIYMVKANAYGHGLIPIANYLTHNLGAKSLGVASLGEGTILREEKIESDIYIFSDLNFSKYKELYLEHRLFPVIANFEDLNSFLSLNSDLPLIIKVDTGMHRLGFSFEEMEAVCDLIKKAGINQIDHLMTHFANSFLKITGKDKTTKQYEVFKSIKSFIQTNKIHILNTSCSASGAIEQGIGLDETHIRPGLMLYGPSALMKNSTWKGRGISELKSSIIKIMKVKKGMPIGYGGHVCAQNGHVIYLPLGYGDGMLTYYSGGHFFIEGQKFKILGRVNMDMMALFSENLPTHWQVGTKISLWNGGDSSVRHLAQEFKTHEYQIFTAISERVPRRFES